MLNVANLEPYWFAAILAGTKRTEYRHRRRIDPRLEAITRGEPLALLERGSDRVIHAVVVRVIRRQHEYGYQYAIAFNDVRAGRAQRIRKLQGWHRRTTL